MKGCKHVLLALGAGLCSVVNAYAQPANDDCGTAVALTVNAGATCTAITSGTTSGATASAVPLADCSGATTDDDVWYSFQATATGHRVSLLNADEDMVLTLYSGSCGSLTELYCADEPEALNATGLVVGQTYYCRVWTYYAGDVGNFDICVSALPPPPSNDVCASAVELINAPAVTGTNIGANDELVDPGNCSFFEGANDVWYKLTANTSGSVTVTQSIPDFTDLVLEILSGADCGNLTELDCDGSAYLSGVNEVTFTTVAGTTYYVRTYGWSGTEESDFTIQAAGTPLPVAMDLLQGKLGVDGRAFLSWHTFSEQNNKGFRVQRSEDSRTFSDVGFVNSLAEGGNSGQQLSYSFTDAGKAPASVYYRLQQEDRDGKTTYSNTIRLVPENGNAFSLNAAPNPFTNTLKVSVAGAHNTNGMLVITDITGKIVWQATVQAAVTDIDMSRFSNGLYLVRYTDDSRSETVKVTKQ